MQDEVAVRSLFGRERPARIIHCAGICDVKKCETSPEFAYEVNVRGMEILLDHLPAETRLIYVSSDHVYSGDSGPYSEAAPSDPISVYGRTRALAEEMLLARHERSLVVRAGLWIGPSYNGRIGHLDWLRYRTARRLPMTVVADEYRSAVWAEDAAARVVDLAESEICGVRHITARRIVSRPELASYLDREFAIGADFAIARRSDLDRPHPGRIDLRTDYTDELARPLRAVIPDSETWTTSGR